MANNYIWMLLHFSGTMLLCLSFPLVSPAFLLYLVAMHLVDVQNLRLFYTAKEHQPVLLRTAVQMTVYLSLLSQVRASMLPSTSLPGQHHDLPL